MPSAKPTHTVKVHVSGTVDVPVNLAMLEDLQDPQLAQGILQECVKLAVAERIGYFDGITVTSSFTPSPSSAPSEAAQGTPRDLCCMAELDLSKLGMCVAAIQEAYNHVMSHALALRQMLALPETEPSQEEQAAADEKEHAGPSVVPRCGDQACELNRAAMLTVLEAMLKGPASIVEAAAVERERPKDTEDTEASAAQATDAAKGSQGVGQERSGASSDGDGADKDHEAWDYRRDDPQALGYRRLLQDNDEEDEEEDEADGQVNGRGGDDGDGAGEVDYARMGYTAL